MRITLPNPMPPVDEALVVALEQRFRDTIPTTVVSEGELGRLVGQQEVIRFLRHTFNEQTNPNPDEE